MYIFAREISKKSDGIAPKWQTPTLGRAHPSQTLRLSSGQKPLFRASQNKFGLTPLQLLRRLALLGDSGKGGRRKDAVYAEECRHLDNWQMER